MLFERLYLIQLSTVHDFCKLNDGAYFIKYSKILVYDDPTKITSTTINNTCAKNISSLMYFEVRNDQNTGLNKNFNFYNLFKINYNIQKTALIKIIFVRTNGFNLEHSNSSVFDPRLRQFKACVSFPESLIYFYYKNKIIESCSDIKDLNLVSFFNIISFEEVTFERYRKIKKICPYIFKNINFRILYVYPMFDTFYLKNIIVFEKVPYDIQINATITELSLQYLVKFKLNEYSLNINLFKELRSLNLIGNIETIQGNFLNNFKNLRQINFDGQNFRRTAHNTKLKWIYDLNPNFKIDSKNISQLALNLRNVIKISVIFNSPSYVNSDSNENFIHLDKAFPDVDFCLYKDFPFDNLIIMAFDTYHLDRVTNLHVTCSVVWLVHPAVLFTALYETPIKDPYLAEQLLKSHMNAYETCNFPMRIALCSLNQTLTKIKHQTTLDLFFYTFFLLEAFNFFLIPLSCLFGLILNGLTFYLITKLDSNKNHKIDKQFYYMKMNAIFNLLICLIELMRPLYIWSFLSGNGIWHNVLVQYIKIIFNEFLYNLLKFLSSSSYILFSSIRCSLVGQEHFFLDKLMNYNPKKLLYKMILIGFFLNLIKLFSFEINYFDPFFDYPSPKSYNYVVENNIKGAILISSLNLLCDFVNYILFIILHLILDIILIFKLRDTLKRRKEKFPEMSMTKSDEFQYKSLGMVILNTSFNFFLRLPGMIEFLFWNRRFINFVYKKTGYLAKIYFFVGGLSVSYVIHNLVVLSTFFYLVSLSLNFLMMYSFNNIFKKTFKKIFQKELSKNEASSSKQSELHN
ncbi:unnamed protein product [Brachionus calyciflorus]|uniref:Uncharacterized protein n=1 Tax=Brachionus calyciflorus TaxID=104777 RepID=A0A813XL25_9BILA|nr:unnamed protein product [Brachionus calyciflorus]